MTIPSSNLPEPSDNIDMGRYRIGNNLTVIWDVKKNGVSMDLTDKKVSLYMTHAQGREECTDDIVINGSTITFVFDGLKQKVLGRYTLTVDVRNNNGSRALITDKCGAFTLVGRSCAENLEEDNYIIYL